MPIASSGRWIALTAERLNLDQNMGPVMTGPIFLLPYKQCLNGSRYRMNPITVQDLMTLEGYDKARSSFRQAVMARKKNRLAPIGPDVVLSFEDRTTILYQVQEMLRVERIFKRAGIQEELDAYNPLIPDGSNWKATMMIQIPDVATRRRSADPSCGY